MGLNPGYLLKSFPLYLLPFITSYQNWFSIFHAYLKKKWNYVVRIFGLYYIFYFKSWWFMNSSVLYKTASTADSWNLRDGWWGRNFPSHKKNLWYYCIMGWINFWRRRNHKDHLILKGLLGFFNFPKKRTKHFCPSRLRQK